MPEHYRRTPNVACKICGKKTYRRPKELEKSGGVAYCSVACYGFSCRKPSACVVCGKMMLTSMNKKTCGRICANKHRAGMKYKLHLPRKDKVRNQRALKLRLLLERSEVCERCGYNKIEILQVHHKDRDTDHNTLSNLELICPNCHAEEHYSQNSWLKDFDQKYRIGGVG